MHPYAIFTLMAGACYLIAAAWISRRFGKHHLGWRRVFGLVGFVIGATFVVTYRLPPEPAAPPRMETGFRV